MPQKAALWVAGSLPGSLSEHGVVARPSATPWLPSCPYVGSGLVLWDVRCH